MPVRGANGGQARTNNKDGEKKLLVTFDLEGMENDGALTTSTSEDPRLYPFLNKCKLLLIIIPAMILINSEPFNRGNNGSRQSTAFGLAAPPAADWESLAVFLSAAASCVNTKAHANTGFVWLHRAALTCRLSSASHYGVCAHGRAA